MRPARLFLALGIVFLVACCSSHAPLAAVAPHAIAAEAGLALPAARSEVPRRQVEAEVRDALAAMEAAERALDTDALLALLAPDFVMVQDGQHLDRDATVEQIRSTMPSLRKFEPHFDEILVFVIDADTVLTTMIFRDEIVDADGITQRMWGPSTMLWQRRSAGWQIAFADSDHYPVDDVTDG